MLSKVGTGIALLFIVCLITVSTRAILIAQTAKAITSPESVRTLILTNQARMDELYGTLAANTLLNRLAALSNHTAVGGRIIQLERQTEIADAYAAWQSNQTSVAHANVVVNAIKALIMEEVAANDTITFIVLVGDDRVIPFYRIADETTLSPERVYTSVPASTTVGSALANNFVLSDDFYGDTDPSTSGEVIIPELMVGRLVETPTEIQRTIAQFIDNNGLIRADSALIAGFDFIEDAAEETCTQLSDPPEQVTMTTDCTLIGSEWTVAELNTKLRTSTAGLFFYYGTADHAQLSGPDSATLAASDMPQWNFPPTGRIAYMISDHTGLTVPPAAPQAVDWPQAWLGQGAVLVANTGYAYGLLHTTGLSEKLGILFATNLIDGMPGVVVGDAMNDAKHTYFAEESTISAYDIKVLNELTLFGLPMYQLVTPVEGGTPTPTPQFASPTPQPPTPTSTPQVDPLLPGALIIVGGRLRTADTLQANINHVTNLAYQRFFEYGYSHERIYYISSNLDLDPTGDGQPDVDATATITNLRTAITDWAVDLVSAERPLTLYLIDHGAPDLFYLDGGNNQTLSPTELDEWLLQVEKAVPGLQVNIVMDQSNAGSFIVTPNTVSRSGRLVIASTQENQDAYATTEGALFSDSFLAALQPGLTLNNVFQVAKSETITFREVQVPMLDGNGNGISNEVSDQQIAAARILFAGTPNATATRTPVTPTPTIDPIASATFTATPLVSPTATPTPADGRDEFEEDNSCSLARPIQTNGNLQHHTFHIAGDTDWVKFDVVKNVTYQIDVSVPLDSFADVQLELYDICGGDATVQDSFGPEVRLRVRPEEDTTYYLRLANYDPEAGGKDISYQIATRALPTGPTPGALIIVGGRLRVNDELQSNIYQATNTMYKLFMARGYTSERIFYLANDLNLDADNTPLTQDVDALATSDRLEYALTQWATSPELGLGPDRALTLYLMDHGEPERFYLNGYGDTITPSQLDEWLSVVEAAAPGIRINVIIDACNSGSFIIADDGLSKPGRVIITSAASAELAYASTDGTTVFTTPFIQALASEKSLYHAFQEVHAVGLARPFPQTVWIDDNGNGIPNDATDGEIAQQRGFAFAGSLSVWDAEAPYISWVAPPDAIENRRGQLRAKVLSESRNFDVWAIIYEPLYEPPPPNDELAIEGNLPLIRLEDVDGDGIFTGLYTGFDQIGEYHIVVYAEDERGLRSRPRVITIKNGELIYLPVVSGQ